MLQHTRVSRHVQFDACHALPGKHCGQDPSYKRDAVNGEFAFCTVMSGTYRVFQQRSASCVKTGGGILFENIFVVLAVRQMRDYFCIFHPCTCPAYERCYQTTPSSLSNTIERWKHSRMLWCLLRPKVKGLTHVYPNLSWLITHSQATGPKLQSRRNLEEIGASLEMQINKKDNLVQP